MRLGLSVPKMNAVGADGEGGPIFCSVCAGAEEFYRRTAGKILVLADGTAFSALLPASRLPRAVTLLWEGDAIGLFAMPDVGCVLASGGADVLRAARFFAAVRRIPCLLFPREAAQDGAWERRARVNIAGEEQCVALAEADVVCDLSLMRDSLAEGYARLPLARLALFEADALGAICRRPFGGEAYERAFSLLDGVRGELPPEQIAARNAAMRRLEDAGAPIGEGRALMRLHGGALPALYALRALEALYAAFLRFGVPRRYFVPDYRARAAAAGVRYTDVAIPDAGEYAARAIALERARGALYGRLRPLLAAQTGQLRAVRVYAPAPAFRLDLTDLERLPELAPDGLCAVLRDFGLMERS